MGPNPCDPWSGFLFWLVWIWPKSRELCFTTGTFPYLCPCQSHERVFYHPWWHGIAFAFDISDGRRHYHLARIFLFLCWVLFPGFRSLLCLPSGDQGHGARRHHVALSRTDGWFFSPACTGRGHGEGSFRKPSWHKWNGFFSLIGQLPRFSSMSSKQPPKIRNRACLSYINDLDVNHPWGNFDSYHCSSYMRSINDSVISAQVG